MGRVDLHTTQKEEYVSDEKEQRMKSVTLLLDKSLSETKTLNIYNPILLEKEKRIAKATLFVSPVLTCSYSSLSCLSGGTSLPLGLQAD